MPLPLNLSKGLEKGELDTLKVSIGYANRVLVPSGECWLILDGMIAHITLTNSLLTIYDKDSPLVADMPRLRKFMALIDSTEGTATYPLFNTAAHASTPTRPMLMIAMTGDAIQFDGDTGAYTYFTFLRWKP
jgi:hypothetical protein